MSEAIDDQTPQPIPLDTGLPAAESQKPDAEDEDPPLWVQQSSLADVLLWRLGIPLDRDRIAREHARSEKGINLAPPLTTRKVADAIANLSLQVIRGELDAASAKTSLYALQTLLTALRLQIIEQKKPKDTTKKKARKPARRSKQSAKPKR